MATTQRLGTRPTAEVLKVEDLVGAVRDGRVRIPKFQRPLRWSSDHVVKLFDSILRGYPIGTLLFWRRPAEPGQFRLGPLQFVADGVGDALWVVDGQQRITTLASALLRPDDSGIDPFLAWYSFETGSFYGRNSADQRTEAWLPVRLLGDLERLLPWMAQEPSEARRREAQRVAKLIREFPIPTYIVETDDEAVARDIFDRLNSSGVPLAAADIFNALHGGRRDQPTDLGQLGRNLKSLGFGTWDEDLLLKVVLGVAGLDLSRSREDLVRSGTDLASAVLASEAALARVAAFLKEQGHVAHRLMAPYELPLAILALFFARFPDPRPRNRALLARWLWRGAWSGRHNEGSGGAVKANQVAVQETADESAAVQGLLALVPGPRSGEAFAVPDVPSMRWPRSTQSAGARARQRLLVQALVALKPRDLDSGARIDPGAHLERHGRHPYPVVGQKAGDHIGNRLLHPPKSREALLKLLRRASDKVLASHGFLPSERSRVGDAAVLEARNERLVASLGPLLRGFAGLDDSDRPPISALLVDDEAP